MDDNDKKTNQDNLENKNPNSKIGKIIVDRDLCIGAGPCVIFAPETFELDSEGKAIVKDLGVDTDEQIMSAAMSCPVLAIKIFDKDGNQIYPR